MGRFTPLLSTTDSNEALDPEVDRCRRAPALHITGTRSPFAKETAIDRGCTRPMARRNDNGRRGADAERRYGFVGGKSSEGRNPKSVTDMKQGRTVREGANRQEGGKP
jgi:hypothetical protein